MTIELRHREGEGPGEYELIISDDEDPIINKFFEDLGSKEARGKWIARVIGEEMEKEKAICAKCPHNSYCASVCSDCEHAISNGGICVELKAPHPDGCAKFQPCISGNPPAKREE